MIRAKILKTVHEHYKPGVVFTMKQVHQLMLDSYKMDINPKTVSGALSYAKGIGKLGKASGRQGYYIPEVEAEIEVKAEAEISYAEIGQAIYTKIIDLAEEIKVVRADYESVKHQNSDLIKLLDASQKRVNELNIVIEKLNTRIIELNAIKSNNGKVKLEEVARFSTFKHKEQHN